MKIGDRVDYHSAIGEGITSRNHTITAMQIWSHGKEVAWITGKSGCVSVDALTLSLSEAKP